MYGRVGAAGGASIRSAFPCAMDTAALAIEHDAILSNFNPNADQSKLSPQLRS